MNLFFRLIYVLILARFCSRLAPLDTSAVGFRVLPNDLDLNMHMNNGRYLTLMDLGRIDFMMRTGLGKVVMQRRWMPVIASAKTRWRRSLLPFQPYTLETRLLCWGEKWFFMEQRFVRNGRTVAYGLVKGLIRRSGGHVPPAEVFEAVLGEPLASPPMSDDVRAWMALEEQISVDD